MVTIECGARTIREINSEIRGRISAGEPYIEVSDPHARHNLAVGIVDPVHIKILGSVGYYCGGLIDGARIEIEGSAGWGLAESMLSGEVILKHNAGNGAGAAIRSGTMVIHGDAAARLGVSMKGGTILVGGNCGYMAGFMGQKGRLIVCGNTGDAFADSLYDATCYVGGQIAEIGNDAVIEGTSVEEAEMLDELLDMYFKPSLRHTKAAGRDFRKVVSGKKLWNFNQSEWKIWQEAL